MKVLTIADVEERCLWDFYSEKRFGDVDLILSAGDLDPDYLEFLVTVTNKPLLYVRGNHDDRYARRAPGGCLCVEDEVYVYRGLRVAGLGGPATWSTAMCTRATTPPSSASGRCLAARRWSMPADTPSLTSRGRAAGIAAGAPRG